MILKEPTFLNIDFIIYTDISEYLLSDSKNHGNIHHNYNIYNKYIYGYNDGERLKSLRLIVIKYILSLICLYGEAF